MAMMKRMYDEMHDAVNKIVQDSWDYAVGEVDTIRDDATDRAKDLIYDIGKAKGLDQDDVEWLFKGSEYETIEDFVQEQFDHCWDL